MVTIDHARHPLQVHQQLARCLEPLVRTNDLADLRDRAALTKLPAEERPAFTQLWADVATLARKAHEQERTQWEASALADREIAAGRTQDARGDTLAARTNGPTSRTN